MFNPKQIEKPGDVKEPDFSYESKKENEDEKVYVIAFLALLAAFYKKYKGKDVNYALKNIDKDADSFYASASEKIDIEPIFNKAASKELLSAGILSQNLNKIDLSDIKSSKISDMKPKNISLRNIDLRATSIIAGDKSVKGASKLLTNLIKEQASTLKGITEEIRYSIKSQAYYLLNRESERLFNAASSFTRGASRISTMAESAFNNAKALAERQAIIFLYDDPLSNWVLDPSLDNCDECMSYADASPAPISRFPIPPIHNHCGCDVIQEKDLNVTDRAVELFYDEMG